MEEKQEFLASDMQMTAGEILRNARTTGRRKREIGTIAKLLCIREEFLEALESGNYRVIPEDVYILGFARSYAVELGLNPDEIIEKLKQELGIVSEKKEEKKEEIETKPEPKIEKVEKTHRKNILNKAAIASFITQSVSYVKKHWIWFAGGLVLIAVLIVGIVLFVGTTSQDLPQQPVVETVAEAPITDKANKEPDFRFPVRERFNEKSRKESRVVLQAEKESWVKIEDARGNTAFSRVLVPGDVYYMPLGDKYKGTFGNAGGIDVWVDGQLINKVGAANTRKTGFSMAPDALKATGLAE